MSYKHDLEAAILASLEAAPAHGYEISRRIRNRSEELFATGEGRLYPALHALEKAGYLDAEWESQETKPPRKVYRLTEKGRNELAHRRENWERFRSAVESVMAPSTLVRRAHGSA